MKVFITYKIPQKGILLLKQYFDVEVYEGEKFLERDKLLKKIRDADAVITLLRDKVDKEFIDSAPNLKVIANYAVGYNNIDIKYASKKRIFVTNTPGVLTEATADIAFALLLSVARKILVADKFVRNGLFEGWKPELFLGYDLYNKILGILGMGRIGQAVAKRGVAFGMKIFYHNRNRLSENIEKKYCAKYVDIETLFSKSDFISIHTPLTEQTYHLVDERLLSLMKPTSILINTARGAVVDEKALYNFLKKGRIAGAGLDVYEYEPKITKGLEKLNNVVLLPHIGSATYETREKMAIMAAKNVIAGLHNKIPPNLIPEQQTLF